ncbi:bifunctional Ribosomal protein L25-Gln-tRNA synthetase [Babesia duncani]|uniref:glutamine--tRNA ligase n=1 Tax=Babesia duncani TaxID=323732 RepID=A0AAD9UP65_9APIC|nr:bifunctional Ribosomal protein L25-Gln-tRNA synthetase [Babesia duncani]
MEKSLKELSLSGDDHLSTNFIYKIAEKDIAEGKFKTVITRFPPEPNGFLHIGHAKSIVLNFELAKKFGGRTHLRFDDTNPATELQEYIDSIQRDVKWLGYDWGEHLYYASDYFQELHDWAVDLIKKGLAYVDDQSIEMIRSTRGSLTTPGVESPYRNRSIEENLDLFKKMRDGAFPDGHCVLRAKIDMASGNMNLRDPILYRIMRKAHLNTGTKWIIYPMYDYAHGQSDSIEGITHSICTTEFEAHRPLYEWFQEKLGILRTQQIEFARLNLTYCVMSKRILLKIVNDGFVKGWDDPRMPTISGLRRRGCPPSALRDFCKKIGVAKRENLIQIELLEDCMRDTLQETGKRLFAVSDPLMVELENAPEDFEEAFQVPCYPNEGTRTLTIGKRFYIDRKDFQEVPEKGFHRLSVGTEVRLRYCYWIRCTSVVKNGNVIEKVICTYDPSTRGGVAPAEPRKVKATIHFLHLKSAKQAELRFYSRLFTCPNPMENLENKDDFLKNLNRESLQVCKGFCEIDASKCQVGEPIQFERLGYFTKDPDSSDELPVFNLTISLKENLEQDEIKEKHKEAERLKREEARKNRMLKNESKNKNAST